jgi:hypothetical protein
MYLNETYSEVGIGKNLKGRTRNLGHFKTNF